MSSALPSVRCLVWLGLGLLATSVAFGQDATWLEPRPATGVGTEERLVSLEQEVARLRAEAAPAASCTGLGGQGCALVSTAGSRGFYAGYEFLFAKPHLKESFQATETSLLTGAMSLIPFSFNHDLTPRVWFGFETDSGLGVRARYWRYDHTSDPLTLVSDPTTVVGAQAVTVCIPDSISSTPGEVQTLDNASGLDVQTFDLEATQPVKIGRIDFLASAGFRYAKTDQDVSAVLSDEGEILRQLNWDRQFEGFGVVAGAEFHLPLGSWGLRAFGEGQGALLFGRKDLERRDYGTVPTVVSLDSADEVVGAFELGLGLEWARELAIGDFFVRASYEGQLWTEAGAPTLTFLGFEGIGLSLGLVR